MALAFVQDDGTAAGSSNTAIAQAMGSNVAAGSLLVAAIALDSGGVNQVLTVVDTQLNTWTKIVSLADPSNEPLDLWYALNVAAGATTVTASWTAARFATISVLEYSGVATASALDQQITGNDDSSGPASAGPVTTTQADELLFSVVYAGNGPTLTADAAYSSRIQVGKMGAEDRIVSSTGSYSATFTLGTSSVWAIILATFKAAGGAAASWGPLIANRNNQLMGV